MKKTYFLLFCLLIAVSACRQSTRTVPDDNPRQGTTEEEASVESFYDEQKASEARNEQPATNIRMMELPAPLKDRPEQILRKKGFTISYNKKTKVPNWVAWHLTKSHTYGRMQRHNEVFTPDDEVPSPRAIDDDYYTSRYDRGHMCPAGDNKWDAQAMRESFLFSNICPQNHGLNKNEWNDLEIKCREWAREFGAVDIVCGPVFGLHDNETQQKTIGKNKVWVPDAFFKVVLCRKGYPKAIGFIYKNQGKFQRMSDCVYTVDEIERITGIDFYPLLNDNIEDRVEADARLSDW